MQIRSNILIFFTLFGLVIGCSPQETRQFVHDITLRQQPAVSYTYEGLLKGDQYACGQFNQPYGLAVDAYQNLYVVDSGNHRICKFDARLNFVDEFGTFGWGEGELQFPTDVALDRNVHVYVVDSGNKRVVKFNHEGVYLDLVFDETVLPHEILDQIALNSSGELVITDLEDDKIYQVDLYGRLLNTRGGFGQGEGYFNQPRGLWLAPNQDIFIADYGNQRVQVLNSVGNFKRAFELIGGAEPVAITGDRFGNLFVATATTGFVQALSQKGEERLLVGIPDAHQADIGDLAIDAKGRLFISDRTNQAIHVVQISYQ